MKNHKASIVLTLLLFTVLFSSSWGFNITRILAKHPRFASLNELLTQTKLADEINRRQSITVLAVDDEGINEFVASNFDTNIDVDLVRKLMSAHVILEYLDVEKLTKLGLSDKVTTLATLFQTSGLAAGRQGFVNVSLVGEGEITFGSAARGGGQGSKLVGAVAAQPYNISVLEITKPILVPGIKAASPAAAPKRSPRSHAGHIPRRRHRAPAPAPAPAPAEAPVVGPAGPTFFDLGGGSRSRAATRVVASAVLVVLCLVA